MYTLWRGLVYDLFHIQLLENCNKKFSDVVYIPKSAMWVGPILTQRRYCRPDVGPALAQLT